MSNDNGQSGRRSLLLNAVQGLLIPLLAVTGALLVGSAVIALVGADPWKAYTALYKGAFGSQVQFNMTLLNATPLLLAGLAVVLAFRGGTFNIGGEGQLYMGALFATWAGTTLPLPGELALLAALLAGLLGGLLWGAIPGYLKATRGFNEVITTILLNYIAIWLVSYFVHGPMKEPGWNPQSRAVFEAARLPILDPRSGLNLGIVIAILTAFLVYLLLEWTTLGFSIRMVGLNRTAAAYAGVNVPLTMALTLGLSGALAGLAGTVEVLGRQYRLLDGFSPGYGFDAIAVALLARLNPWGTIFSAIFFGALRTGANGMQVVARLPVVVVYVLEGLVILFTIAGNSGRFKLRRKAVMR
ncbi:MAG: ABC transporter permease [Firmicutes bacterium]|nr:ABC transporter permease [Bacillota bacterium]MCL5039235.1 ABC transporter permease [Bacillota bacterium]